ncbi:MAG: polysaccharide deacetylase family protein [FCB group bacterium]|nr:polysaccharide deacetylase family protein [FCB group bacterium]
MDYTSYLDGDVLGCDSFPIFLFHGVIRKQKWNVRNRNRKHLELDYFTSVIKSLYNAGNPVSMDEIVWHHNHNEPLPDKSFAVTFDDGYRNNFDYAVDVLEKFGIPTTFYVATEFIAQNTSAYIDYVEYAYEVLDKDPEIINRRAMKSPCIPTTDVLRGEIDGLELTDKMTWEQVVQLSWTSLFTIGAHTHTHAILPMLNKREKEGEIFRPLWMLHQHGIVPKHFSYPEGKEDDFDDETISLLKSAGVVCCPTAIHGVNTHETDLFRLKRIGVK